MAETKQKKILVTSFSNLKNAPRIQRYIHFLKETYNISALGVSSPQIKGVNFFRLHKRRCPLLIIILIKFFLNFLHKYETSLKIKFNLKQTIKELGDERFDLIIARGIETWPFALKIANGAKVIFDAPEYYPKEFDDKLWWRLFVKKYYNYLCSKYLKQGDAVMAVCSSIAEEYYKNFWIKAEVITNAGPYTDLLPVKVESEDIRIIHHGAAISSRKTELMIDAMNYTDERFTLYLMLVPMQRVYFKYLQKKANGRKNIKFIPTVSMREVPIKANNYDIGFYLLPPVNLNHEYALPNKFFEFIQARLAVAIGPSKEMASIVKKYDCGIVSPSFSPKDMAKELNLLTKEKIFYYKNQSHKAARELSMEDNSKKFNKIVKDLLYNPRSLI
jgi:hypothetical protein